MKELFTGFLTVSLSGSLIIGLVLLVRILFRKAPKRVLCALWLLVILRLLLPVQLESPFSIRPETPEFSRIDTQFFGERDLMFADELPEYMPVQVEYRFGNAMATVDYIWILSLVWTIGVSVLLAYTIITYIRLKYLVRESVRIEKNIFECSHLDSAFLLGYFSPRIYIPHSITEEHAGIVIAHEQAHIRRGDHWLKLLAFIMLALHWFNPLVWVAYLLICRDIEAACDERVIRELDEQGRADYSSALLACGKDRRTIAGCPVAFGEVSIRSRIVNVLKYRKPAVWMTVIAVILVALIAVFFMTDPGISYPPYHEQLYNSIGQPVEVVCENLNISKEDLIDIEPRGLNYELPMKAEYAGGEFSVILMFDTDYLLSGFHYWCRIQGDRRKGAEVAAEVAEILSKNYGEQAKTYLSKRRVLLTDATVDVLLEQYENKRESSEGVGGVSAAWDVSDKQSPHIIEHLYHIRDSEWWHNRYDRYGDDLQRPFPYPRYCVTYETYRHTESDTVIVKLFYGRTDINTDDGGVRYRDYEQQNWLERAVAWLK